MKFIGIIDILLFPLYVWIFYMIFSARRKRIKNPILQKYHRQFFWVKIVTTIAFTIFYLFISVGDSTSLYFPEGLNIFHLILKDPAANIKWIFLPGKDFDESLLTGFLSAGYLKGEGNYFIVRLVAILSFFSFGRYIIINLFFAMIAYTGVWQLYKFFYEQYPHLHKRLAIAILFLPTPVFWTSGILKDPISMAMLGWITYAMYYLLYKRKGFIKNILIIFVAGYSLFIVKAYILLSYLPFFILFIVLKSLKNIKTIIFKLVIGLFLVSLTVLTFFIVADKLKDQLGLYAVDNLAETVKTQQDNYIDMADDAKSSFSLGVEFDGSPGSLIKMAPAAITATLYRPFIWESKKISTLLSSLESLAMMLLLLYVFFKVGPVNFITSFFKDPMILFSFCFAIVFALFVGATTLNFGTLVRYKIPCLPFYIIALLLILDIYNKRKTRVAIKKNARAEVVQAK